MAILMLPRRMGLDNTARGFRSSFLNRAAERTSLP
jgi:hypothetical protein